MRDVSRLDVLIQSIHFSLFILIRAQAFFYMHV